MAYSVRKVCVSKQRYPKLFAYLDECARKEKLLANAALFRLRNNYTAYGKDPDKLQPNEKLVQEEIVKAVASGMQKPLRVLSYMQLEKVMRTTRNPDFFSGLPSQTAQHCLKRQCQNFNAWLEALKAYKKNPSAFTGKPKMPGYIKADTASMIFTNQACHIRNGLIRFPKTKEKLSFGSIPADAKLKEVQVSPEYGSFTVFGIFEIPDADADASDLPYRAAIDFGVDNFASIAADTDTKCLICKGGALKAENQWFNKRMAEAKACCMKGRDPKTYHCPQTHLMKSLCRHRKNFFNDYFHKLSKRIVSWCLKNRIGTLVLGHNDGWKQDADMGRRNNQNFVQLPYATFIRMLQYQCERTGIRCILQEESYTSKASAADRDAVPVYKQGASVSHHFSGKRVRRGLYRTADGLYVNADLNGAANILRKAFPDAFDGKDIYNILREVETIRFSDLYKCKRLIPATAAP